MNIYYSINSLFSMVKLNDTEYMELDIVIILSLSVFVTSLISAILGLAGGLILLVIFLQFLSVPEALFFHGFIQFFSNFFRFFNYRKKVVWSLLGPYLLAWLLIVPILLYLPLSLEKNSIYLFLSIVVFTVLLSPKKFLLNIENPLVNFGFHCFANLFQVFVGVSGPVASLFLNSSLTRFQILGTMSLFQFVGHITKVIYYVPSMAVSKISVESSLLFLTWGVFLAFAGNSFGKQIVQNMKEKNFKYYGKILVFCVGISLLYKTITL